MRQSDTFLICATRSVSLIGDISIGNYLLINNKHLPRIIIKLLIIKSGHL